MPRSEAPLVAVFTAIGVAIGVYLALFVPVGSPPVSRCSSRPSGPTPLGTAFALGVPVESNLANGTWYNFSIESARPAASVHDLAIQILSALQTPVRPGATWSVEISDARGGDVAQLAWNGTYWTAPGGPVGSAPLISGEWIDLFAAPPSLSGDSLAVQFIGVGYDGCALSGSTTASIP